jgi:exodeoxyribonuclease VII large subunit
MPTAPQAEATIPSPIPTFLTLAELADQVRTALEDQVGGVLRVVAEISTIVRHPSGHCYIDLIEKPNPKTEIRFKANLWKSNVPFVLSKFEGSTGTPLAKGMKVLFEVRVIYHSQYGLSLTIDDIDPNYTLGEHRRSREQIIAQLETEGFMMVQKGLTLRLVPQRIAIVSAATAAGYEDFFRQLTDNDFGYSYQTTLFTATMQGVDTESSVLNALKAIEARVADFDVLVIIRGGGGEMDLASFDNYAIGKALALFPIPVLSGIGHEKDVTVPDLVAYQNLKTPTAVAEYIIGLANQFEAEVELNFKAILQFAQKQVLIEDRAIGSLQSVIIGLAGKMIPVQASLLTSISERISAGSFKLLEQMAGQVTLVQEQVRLLDPQRMLERGYVLVYQDGTVVRTRAGFTSAKEVELHFQDGVVSIPPQ